MERTSTTPRFYYKVKTWLRLAADLENAQALIDALKESEPKRLSGQLLEHEGAPTEADVHLERLYMGLEAICADPRRRLDGVLLDGTASKLAALE